MELLIIYKESQKIHIYATKYFKNIWNCKHKNIVETLNFHFTFLKNSFMYFYPVALEKCGGKGYLLFILSTN
jgi:hypothetical protein